MPTSIVEKLYHGHDPRDAPAYLLSEAAHHLRLPLATVRSWVVGRTYKTRAGPTSSEPLIDIADAQNRLLSFRNLLELHVLSALRRTHHVEMPSVRAAIKFLKDYYRTDHPLLDQNMLTDGKDLFIEKYEHFVNISRQGQMEMRQVLEIHLQRIEWDRSGTPVRLFPFSRDRYERSPRVIAIDPRIRFGKPCLAGTGIPTTILAERYSAGDSISELAQDYGRLPCEIEEAIRYESRMAS